MASTSSKLETLLLSADEWRNLKWGDETVVRELLNTFRNIVELADSVDEAEDAGTSPQSQSVAILSDVSARLGSGDPLTSDETGFTVDTTRLTVDQDEA